MFPEARRSTNTQLGDAYDGAALLASRNKVTILPVGITGTEKMKGFKWLLKRPEVIVNVGKPFDLPLKTERLTREGLSEYTYLIMQHIAALLPERYRGRYPAYREENETES